MTHSFSIREAIRFGWHTVKNNSALVFQVVLTMLAVQIAQSIVERVLENSALGMLAYLVLGIAGIFLGTGTMLIALKLARHEHATYSEIWPDWRLVWRFFASGMLAGLATALPILIGAGIGILTGLATLGSFLIFSERDMSMNLAPLAASGVAGVVVVVVVSIAAVAAAAYIALRYSMSRFEVLDGAGIVASLRKSAIITRGVKWKLFGFIVVIAAMNIVGALLLLLPLLVTIPVSMIALAHVYTKLRAHHHA